MNWTTLYITGKADFREDVLRRMEASKLEFMPGYLENSMGPVFNDLYWVSERHSVREIKEAIGSKLIWKFRLRFYRELEELLESTKNPDDNTDGEDFEIPAALRKSA